MSLVNKNLPEKCADREELRAEKGALNSSVGSHHMRSAENGIGVRLFVIVNKILVGLGSAIHSTELAAGNVVVIVDLMNNRRKVSQVDDWQTFLACVLDAPLVEPDPADGQ